MLDTTVEMLEDFVLRFRLIPATNLDNLLIDLAIWLRSFPDLFRARVKILRANENGRADWRARLKMLI